MAAVRTLVVMEGGHPWGFRIEGGAEVRQPIRINKVLVGGKADIHGIEVGDILSSINGETGRNMTISRARHLIRASDDLLVLEVTRPSKEFLRIPEIRVISPNENQHGSGLSFQWGTSEVPDPQRNMVNRDKVSPRSMSSENSPQKGTSKVPPVPPPKPPRRLPLTAKNHPLQIDSPKQATAFTYPVSPTHTAPPRGLSRSPAVPGGNASVADGGTNSNKSQQGWQGTRSSTSALRGPNYPEKWTFTVYSPPTSPTSGGVQTQRRNTEPAPIKPGGLGGLSGRLFSGKLGIVDSERLTSKRTDPLEAKQFRQRTTDTGTVDRGLSSTAVVLPLSSTFKKPVSENQFAVGKRYVAENPYDLLPDQQIFNVQGQNKSSVQYQNFYNDRNFGTPAAMSRSEKSWPRKIEDFETGYQSSSSRDGSNMYADYDFLPRKPSYQNNLRSSPREHNVQGDRTVCKDQIIGQDHLMYSGRRYDGVTTRQKLDEENLRRKLEIERVIAEEKRRRYLKDLSANTARRHSDFLTPLQRSSLLMDRFSDDELADNLARPIKRVYTKIRGKARALHTFRAQSNRELPFKRNDVIYILRQVDKNWFEGERHGMVGIFPITYVEVLTSLDEAKATAELREGTATAIYNFKAQTGRELPLRKGDVVSLIRRVDENWYEGRLGRCQGIFPVTYVETHREPETPMVTPMPSLATTPVPGTPASCQSPVSSLYSVGPDIPSAPMSPLDSEFYDSDWDTSSVGALQSGRPLRMSRPTSPSHSEISDREVTPVRGVVSPFSTAPANPRFAYCEGLRGQSRSLQPKPSMLQSSQGVDRDITPVRAVTSPTPIGLANARYSSDGPRIQRPVLQPKPSPPPYSPDSDRDITPVRAVTSPTPSGGSANVRYSSDLPTIQRPVIQPKPSVYNQISDRDITSVRAVTSPAPSGGSMKITRYFTDRPRILSPDLQPKPSSMPYSQIPSDLDITPVRAVTSPTPTGSANAQYSSDGPRIQNPDLQPKPSTLPCQTSDQDITPVRAFTSPPPSSTANVPYPSDRPGIQSPDLQPKPSAPPYCPSSDHDITPVREVASPTTPTGSANARLTSEGPRVQKPSLQPKPSTLPLSQNSDPEATQNRAVVPPTPIASDHARSSSEDSKIQNPDVQQTSAMPPDLPLRKESTVAAGIKETIKRSDLGEQTQGQGKGKGQGKHSGSTVAPVKPDAAKLRPPSGRLASFTRALKQRFTGKQQPTEGRERRDGFSKSPRTQNPYLRYKAVYNYKPQNIDELELIRGDVIHVMERCDDGWFVGISEKTKKFGSFPGNFVQPMG